MNNNKFPGNTFSLSFSAAAIIIALAACTADKAPVTTVQKAVQLPGKGVNVYAAGDIADCGKVNAEQSGAAKTAALIAERLANDKDAAVLNLGDSTYPIGMPGEFTDCYEPTWGRFKARTYPVPGNHEYSVPYAMGYYGYFGSGAGPERRGYYSFTLGSWHVISLNSNLKPKEHQTQLDWLKDELGRNKALCTLAYWHHPRYSSGGHGNNDKMADVWNALYAADADLVLASHDHDYERFAPQNGDGAQDDKRGMRQFVVGTGGARLSPFRFRKPNSEVSDNASHGVLKLVLKDSGYEWEFLPVEDGGFVDRGTTLCH
ncbi:alkaline phosphatase [Noviherbaspirillum cavernae]|uniref:Alkaline phosphatase n=1 Tax=Noviherbaspirillum cavernae TaxID=2320862 RepID=A0A418WYJ2_9BURK|nr:metallophosphoesterase [Noviherbaspirillum cavernae]RJG05232.1 alkaline phosphatase [Noviherbaspirillum cavernae]